MAASNKCTEAVGSFANSRNEYRLSQSGKADGILFGTLIILYIAEFLMLSKTNQLFYIGCGGAVRPPPGPAGPVGPAAGSPRLRGVLGQDPAGDGDFPPPDHDGAACGQRRGLRQGGAVRPGLSDGDPGLSVVTEIRRDNRRCPMRDSACLCFFSSENPSAFCCGWGGAVSAGPWPRSGGCAPG